PALPDQLVAPGRDQAVPHGLIQVRERIAHIELLALLPQPGEHLLYDIFRGIARSDEAVGEVAEPPVMRPHQLVEGRAWRRGALLRNKRLRHWRGRRSECGGRSYARPREWQGWSVPAARHRPAILYFTVGPSLRCCQVHPL